MRTLALCATLTGDSADDPILERHEGVAQVSPVSGYTYSLFSTVIRILGTLIRIHGTLVRTIGTIISARREAYEAASLAARAAQMRKRTRLDVAEQAQFRLAYNSALTK